LHSFQKIVFFKFTEIAVWFPLVEDQTGALNIEINSKFEESRGAQTAARGRIFRYIEKIARTVDNLFGHNLCFRKIHYAG